jgi:flagellar biosynthesis anti-sigma factor FlgM
MTLLAPCWGVLASVSTLSALEFIMKIGASLSGLPIDPRREIGRGSDKVKADSKVQTGGEQQSAAGTQVEMALDPQRLQKFIDTLKGMEPSDLHRVEELRQQINDGSYQAQAGDLVDDLLAFLDDGRLEA